jgi:hypothetical protein
LHLSFGENVPNLFQQYFPTWWRRIRRGATGFFNLLMAQIAMKITIVTVRITLSDHTMFISAKSMVRANIVRLSDS